MNTNNETRMSPADVLEAMDSAYRFLPAREEARLMGARIAVAGLIEREAALAARQAEYLCDTCQMIFPCRAGIGPLGYGCKCGGLLRPTSLTERNLNDKCEDQARRIVELEAKIEALSAAARGLRFDLYEATTPELQDLFGGRTVAVVQPDSMDKLQTVLDAQAGAA